MRPPRPLLGGSPPVQGPVRRYLFYNLQSPFPAVRPTFAYGRGAETAIILGICPPIVSAARDFYSRNPRLRSRKSLKPRATAVNLNPHRTICWLGHPRVGDCCGFLSVSPGSPYGLPVSQLTGVWRRSEACRVRRDSDWNVPINTISGI